MAIGGDERVVQQTVASCPLCGGEFEGQGAYSDHLRDVHDLVDEEGVGGHDDAPVDQADERVAPEDGPPELALFSAAAAALARPDEPEPETVAAPPVAPPVPETATGGPDRRPLAILAVLAVVLLLVVGVKVLAGGDDPDGGGGGTSVDGDGVAGGAGGAGEGTATTTTVPPAASTTTAVPPTTAPATTPPTTPPATRPPSTAPPATSSPPPPPTTAPRPDVRATGAAVVSCTRDGGLRTLVYRYVLSGSAADGPRQETLVARGRMVVSQVRAPLPGGGFVTVPLEPEPVTCS